MHDNEKQTNGIQLELFLQAARNTVTNQRIKYYSLQRS